MDPSEAVLNGVTLLASCIYLVVAGVLLRRKVAAESRGPHRAFVFWWAGLGSFGVAGLAVSLGPGLGGVGLVGARIVIYVLLALLCAAVAGLLHYLLYLYTGHKALGWIALFYLAVLALLVVVVEVQEPFLEKTPSGREEIQFRDELPAGHPLRLGMLFGLAFPPLAAAVAYMALYWQVNDRTSRYRILLVSGGIVLWFAYSVVNAVTLAALHVQEPPFLLQLASQLLGVLAAVMVLLAYLPPRWLQRRLGIASVLHEPEPEPERAQAAVAPQLPMLC